MKRRTRFALAAMADDLMPVELRNVDIASFYPTERYIQKLVLGIEPVQSGTGDPSPDNVRPISGFTGVNVYGTGKNMFSAEVVHGLWATTTFYSHEGASSKYLTTKTKIPVVGGNTYTLSFVNDESNAIASAAFLTFDANGDAMQPAAVWVNISTGAIAVPIGAVELAINFVLTNNITSISEVTPSDFQLELSDEATSYSAYVGTTLPVSWQSEAGTVYAGFLTIDKAGNCTLTVTHGAITLPSTGWTYYQTAGKNTFNIRITGAKARGNGLCEIYKFDNVQFIASQPDKTFMFFAVNPSITSVSICDNDYTDAGIFGAAVDGAILVYELEAPVTYTLSSVTPIATIRPGINNVWCDTGPVIELIS